MTLSWHLTGSQVCCVAVIRVLSHKRWGLVAQGAVRGCVVCSVRCCLESSSKGTVEDEHQALIFLAKVAQCWPAVLLEGADCGTDELGAVQW